MNARLAISLYNDLTHRLCNTDSYVQFEYLCDSGGLVEWSQSEYDKFFEPVEELVINDECFHIVRGRITGHEELVKEWPSRREGTRYLLVNGLSMY